MAKNPKNTPSDLEKLQREEIKALKVQLKHLEREIKKQGNPSNSKGAKKRQEALIQEDFDAHDLCEVCGKGHMRIIELGPRKMRSCSVGCGNKEMLKKNAKEKEEVQS